MTQQNQNSEIERSLGRVEGKLDMLLNREEDRVAAVSKLEQRVQAVEARVSNAYGVAAGISAAGAVVGYVIRLVSGH